MLSESIEVGTTQTASASAVRWFITSLLLTTAVPLALCQCQWVGGTRSREYSYDTASTAAVYMQAIYTAVYTHDGHGILLKYVLEYP